MRKELRCRQQKSAKYFIYSAVFFLLGSFSSFSQAGTVVRVSTSLGDYSIELFDEAAPVTVQNFLNYVNRNDYNGTFLHRVVDNFVAQGGAYRFQLFVGPVAIRSDGPIVNEFGASNTRGTVAMARLGGVANSATNQWFVNMANNSANLDFVDGGFTVFGQILGDGMSIVDAIDDLPWLGPANGALGTLTPNVPYFTESYNNPLDFVYINVELTQRFSSAPHVFESATGLLISSVDIDNGADLVSMNFNLLPSDTDVLIKANLESVIPRRDSFEGIASYSSTDQRLRIPELEVNLNGSITVVSNVVFVLSDSQSATFILESYDQ